MSIIFKNSGQSIVEALIGGAIVAITATGLGLSLNSMTKSRTKTQVVANVIALESMVVESLQDPSVYGNYKTMLKGGDIAGFTSGFKLPTPGWGSGSVPIGKTAFTNLGAVCTDFATNKDCAFELFLDVKMLTAAPTASYAFAYRIKINSLALPMPNLGSPADTFTAADYRIAIPTTFFNNDVVCPNPGDIAATGFDFDKGELICLHAPTASCAAGSFPVGLQVSALGTLEFKCQALREITCANPGEDFYGISKFSPASLDPRTSASSAIAGSQCLFVAKDIQPALTGPVGGEVSPSKPLSDNCGGGQSCSPQPKDANGNWRYGVTGTFCPTGYSASVTCSAVIVPTPASPPRCPPGYTGTCPAVCATVPNGAWYGTPANAGDPLIEPVIPPPASQTIVTVKGNQASCVLNNPAGPGGAGWSGYVNMQVNCLRDPAQLTQTIPPKVAGP